MEFYGQKLEMTYLNLPFGIDELYVWWLQNSDHIILQVAEQEESWIKR